MELTIFDDAEWNQEVIFWLKFAGQTCYCLMICEDAKCYSLYRGYEYLHHPEEPVRMVPNWLEGFENKNSSPVDFVFVI